MPINVVEMIAVAGKWLYLWSVCSVLKWSEEMHNMQCCAWCVYVCSLLGNILLVCSSLLIQNINIHTDWLTNIALIPFSSSNTISYQTSLICVTWPKAPHIPRWRPPDPPFAVRNIFYLFFRLFSRSLFPFPDRSFFFFNLKFVTLTKSQWLRSFSCV